MQAYTYCFVRTDIPDADQGVQLAHATLEAGKHFQHPDSCHMVVLAAKNEHKLLKAAEMLEKEGIQFRMFWEPDDRMGHTAIATEPIFGAARGVFSKYRLWKSKGD